MASAAPPESSGVEGGSGVDGAPTALSAVSHRLWKALCGLIPSFDHIFLSRIVDLYTHRRPGSDAYQRRRLQSPALPLPLHSVGLSCVVRYADEKSRTLDIVKDIVEHTLSYLHDIHKSLLFWQFRAKGTNSQKVYFMIFERGPQAFVEVIYQLIGRLRNDGYSLQYLSLSASELISRKLALLLRLQHCLASFLGEVYSEVNRCREILMENSTKSFFTLVVILNQLFYKLEESIKRENMCNQSLPHPQFLKLPEIDPDGPGWTDNAVLDATKLIYQNLQQLDIYVSCTLSENRKPRRADLYWFRYTCGAIGLSACSLWLLRHSSLMGSPDIDNWIHDARESIAGFWNEHVEKPITSIGDELFKTFKRRHKGVIDEEEVQLTANSLTRMLIAFCEQTKGQKLPEGLTDQQMMELVVERYEKELMHPLQNLVNGELARALLIQVQRLKLDLETAMLELDQILKSNEINFSVLAALPAFMLLILLSMLLRRLVMQDKRVEGRGRVARRQRRLLVVEVEKRLLEFRSCMAQGLEEEAKCRFGLMLYCLNRLYKAVESHAKETGEWISLQEDIVALANPSLEAVDKLAIVSRMGRMYDCMLPPLSRY